MYARWGAGRSRTSVRLPGGNFTLRGHDLTLSGRSTGARWRACPPSLGSSRPANPIRPSPRAPLPRARLTRLDHPPPRRELTRLGRGLPCRTRPTNPLRSIWPTNSGVNSWPNSRPNPYAVRRLDD